MAQSIGATPVAVLVGAVLIAAAVYFGLRARPVVAPPGLAAATAPMTADLPGATSASPAAAAPVPPALTGASAVALRNAAAGSGPVNAPDVEADVLAALEKQRATLVDTCWKPATKGQPNPEPASYDIDVSFDAAGHEVAKGLSPKRGVSDELTRCLNIRSPSLSIPARGVRTRARVPFTLP